MSKSQHPLEWRVEEGYVDYDVALKTMEARVEAIKNGDAGELIWLLEHPPLYTAGTSSDPSDLVDPDRFPVYDAGRGGQYTYHGPGQRVVYFMLNLRERERDLRKFIYNLEAVIIESIEAATGIKSERRDGRVGVWVTREDGREEKIAAIGVRIRQWISFHGIAINVEPNLEHFEGIVPCGIAEHGVTSFRDMGYDTPMQTIDAAIFDAFKDVFGLEWGAMKYKWQAAPKSPLDTEKTGSINPEDIHPTFQV